MSYVDADGSLYSIDSTEVEHSVQLTLEFHYFFLRDLKYQLNGKEKHEVSGNFNEAVNSNDLDGSTHKYFVTYKFGQTYEGKSEILHPHNSLWSNAHLLDVNLDLLADFYEYPIEVKIMQVKKTLEPSAATDRSSHIKDSKSLSPKSKSSSHPQPAPPPPQNLVFRRASLNAITKRLVTLSKTERLSPGTVRKIQSYRNYVLHNYQNLPPTVSIRANVNPPKPLFIDLKIPPQPHHSTYMNLSKEQFAFLELNEVSSKTPTRQLTSSRNSSIHINGINSNIPSPTSEFSHFSSTYNGMNLMTVPEDVVEPFIFKRPKTPPQPHHFDNPDRTVSFEPEVPKKTRTIHEQILHVGSIFIDPRDFFLGELQVKGLLITKVDGIQEAEVKITLGSSLLTPKLQFNLNPMVITISSVENLPDQPHPYSFLQKNCQPVYTCFRFLDQPPSRRKSQISLPHAKNLFFDSHHVILTGLHDEDELYNFCLHSSLNVELHDRDLKTNEMHHFASQEFDDSLLHSQSHGIAKFNLSELCQGATQLTLEAPVVPAEFSSTPKKDSLPSGFYLESDTRVKIEIKCKNPIFNLDGSGSEINRAIIFFKKPNFNIIREIVSLVEETNCRQLGIDSISQLHSYRLSREQRHNMRLDIMTGFLISDGESLWLFLEGCIHQGMKKIEELCNKHSLGNDPNTTLLLDTQLLFPTRIWTEIYPNLSWIHLKTPVSKIPKTSKAFLRSNPSKIAFQLLRTCHDISTLDRSSSFQVMFSIHSPSLEQFQALSEVALHVYHFVDMRLLSKFLEFSFSTSLDLKKPKSEEKSSQKVPAQTLPKLHPLVPKPQKTKLKLMFTSEPSKVLPRERAPLDFTHPIYLYSCQALNTRSQLQKEVEEIFKKNKRLYTFFSSPRKALELGKH